MEKTQNTKFAVAKLAGKQLKVVEGKTYEIDKLDGNKGDKLVLDQVLLVVDGETVKIGTPLVEGAKVNCVIDSQKKGEKVDVFKYKAKARYRKTMGIRPLLTRILVEKIEF